MDFQSDDPDFTVSWLLGLQLQRSNGPRPIPLAQFVSKDDDFSVTWLLGLSSRSRSNLSESAWSQWAKPFLTTDPNFSVSWLLGLALRSSGSAEREGRARSRRKSTTARKPTDETDDGVTLVCNEDADKSPDEDLDETGETEEEAKEASPESEQDTVLAEPEFLELCAKLEELVSDIECVSA
jgi:hypothetical protein